MSNIIKLNNYKPPVETKSSVNIDLAILKYVRQPTALAIWAYCTGLNPENYPTKRELLSMVTEHFNISRDLANESIMLLEDFMLVLFWEDENKHPLDNQISDVLNFLWEQLYPM